MSHCFGQQLSIVRFDCAAAEPWALEEEDGQRRDNFYHVMQSVTSGQRLPLTDDVDPPLPELPQVGCRAVAPMCNAVLHLVSHCSCLQNSTLQADQASLLGPCYASSLLLEYPCAAHPHLQQAPACFYWTSSQHNIFIASGCNISLSQSS